PHTPGEAAVFLDALGSRATFRPRDWEATVAELLRHDIPYVRELAVKNLPVPPPRSLAAAVPDRILALGGDGQIAALDLAGKWKAPGLKEPVLKALATARETWALRSASNAASALGLNYEPIEVWVSRLDEKGMTAQCLDFLASWVIANRG